MSYPLSREFYDLIGIPPPIIYSYEQQQQVYFSVAKTMVRSHTGIYMLMSTFPPLFALLLPLAPPTPPLSLPSPPSPPHTLPILSPL